MNAEVKDPSHFLSRNYFCRNMSVSRVTGYGLEVQSSLPGSSAVHNVHHISVATSTQVSFLSGNSDQRDKLSTQRIDEVENTHCFFICAFTFVNFSVGRYDKTVYETRC
jgi:hypothetical protein